MDKLVSVVMPVYHSETFLEEAVQSIADQTYTNLELIIVDGEKDSEKTLQIINKFKIPLKYCYEPKRGVAAALNRGIELAQGEYIARMDADDIAYPDRIEKQVRFFESHPEIMICGTNAEHIDENGKSVLAKSAQFLNDDDIRVNLIFGCSMYHPSVMFRRQIFEDGYFYDENELAEDYDLWTRLAGKYLFANLEKVLLKYRFYSESASQVQQKQVLISAANISKKYIQRITKIDIDEYDLLHFMPPKNFILKFGNQEGKLVKQLELLKNIIYKNNQKIHFWNDNILEAQMHERWNCIFGEIGIEKDICTFKKNTIMLEKQFVEYRDRMRTLAKEKKRFILYSLGIRGREFWELYTSLYQEKKINWVCCGLADKNVREVLFDKKHIRPISPKELQNQEFDYILIPTIKYFEEIRNELMGYGIAGDKIMNANWIRVIDR